MTLDADALEAAAREQTGLRDFGDGYHREGLERLVASMNEARRAIAEGGAYVNNNRVTDPESVVSRDELLHGRFLVLRRGKKTVAGVEVVR